MPVHPCRDERHVREFAAFFQNIHSDVHWSLVKSVGIADAYGKAVRAAQFEVLTDVFRRRGIGTAGHVAFLVQAGQFADLCLHRHAERMTDTDYFLGLGGVFFQLAGRFRQT